MPQFRHSPVERAPCAANAARHSSPHTPAHMPSMKRVSWAATGSERQRSEPRTSDVVWQGLVHVPRRPAAEAAAVTRRTACMLNAAGVAPAHGGAQGVPGGMTVGGFGSGAGCGVKRGAPCVEWVTAPCLSAARGGHRPGCSRQSAVRDTSLAIDSPNAVLLAHALGSKAASWVCVNFRVRPRCTVQHGQAQRQEARWRAEGLLWRHYAGYSQQAHQLCSWLPNRCVAAPTVTSPALVHDGVEHGAARRAQLPQKAERRCKWTGKSVFACLLAARRARSPRRAWACAGRVSRCM